MTSRHLPTPPRALAAAALCLCTAVAAHANLPTVPSTPEAATAAPASGVGAGGLLQAVLGLAWVLGLILACAWAARRFGLQRFGGGHVVKVVSSTSVGQRERVVVVEVAGQWLVLGVTPQHITPLHSLPAQAGAASDAAPAPGFTGSPLGQATQVFSHHLRQSLGMKPRTSS